MTSKKPSVAKPPDGTVFFIDRSLGVEPIRGALKAEGLSVEIHDDHFARDEEDQVWLRKIGSRGWVILTKDQRLRYRPLEIAALRSSGARVFILVAGNMRGSEIADVFVLALRTICRILLTHQGPFIGRVGKRGQIKLDPQPRVRQRKQVKHGANSRSTAGVRLSGSAIIRSRPWKARPS